MVIVKTTEAFVHWFGHLADRQARLRIQARIDRLESGNPGQHRVLKVGVSEMKIDYGPVIGFHTQRGALLVILQCGGDKRSQRQDIKAATQLAEQLQE